MLLAILGGCFISAFSRRLDETFLTIRKLNPAGNAMTSQE
jgi:hypothetical protein